MYVGENYHVDNSEIIEDSPVRYAFNQNQIIIEQPDAEIVLYSSNGSKVAIFRNENIIDINYLPKGIYLLHYKVHETFGIMKITR